MFWPKRKNLRKDAKTKNFCAKFFVFLFLCSCANSINIQFQKSYGNISRKIEDVVLGAKQGIICPFFEFLGHFKGDIVIKGHLGDIVT